MGNTLVQNVQRFLLFLILDEIETNLYILRRNSDGLSYSTKCILGEIRLDETSFRRNALGRNVMDPSQNDKHSTRDSGYMTKHRKT